MPLMRIAVQTQAQLNHLERHGAKVVWQEGGGWIVEIEAEIAGQASIRLADGSVFNPYAALSELTSDPSPR